jgi:hypothetical protein
VSEHSERDAVIRAIAKKRVVFELAGGDVLAAPPSAWDRRLTAEDTSESRGLYDIRGSLPALATQRYARAAGVDAVVMGGNALPCERGDGRRPSRGRVLVPSSIASFGASTPDMSPRGEQRRSGDGSSLRRYRYRCSIAWSSLQAAVPPRRGCESRLLFRGAPQVFSKRPTGSPRCPKKDFD